MHFFMYKKNQKVSNEFYSKKKILEKNVRMTRDVPSNISKKKIYFMSIDKLTVMIFSLLMMQRKL